MKAFQTLVAAAAVLISSAAFSTYGQETKVVSGPVATGIVVSADRQAGTFVITSAETQGRLIFSGMNTARIETAKGAASTVAALQTNVPVTVHYSTLDGKLHAARIVVPAAIPLPPVATEPLTGAERKALQSPAANDDDITTQPGQKARIDRDITTNPGKVDPRDPDPTKKAGNN